MFNLVVESADAIAATAAEPAWYVVQAKRHRERLSQVALTERGIESYLPRIVQWPRPAVGSAVQPMFPGYLFVRAVLPDEFYRIAWTTGVKGFVTFASSPSPVEPAVIDFLRGREGPDGLIRCGSGILEKSEVLIVDGPFRGLYAIVEQRLPARDRVRVLMSIMQRQTQVELPEQWIRRA